MVKASAADSEALPTLLNPLRRKIHQVSADGAYDTKSCHQLLIKKGSIANIPPRKNAAVTALKAGQLAEWKIAYGYHQRSFSETAMSRYKQLVSPTLSLRKYNGQVGEILAGVKVINKVIELGMPIRQPLR